MTSRRCAALLALVAIAVAGCGSEPPDYQSILPTSSAPPTTPSEAPVSMADYLESVGVIGEPVAPDRLTDLTVSIPTPDGWAPYTNPNFAPGTRVIAKGDTYPIAMLMVFQLTGDFDVTQAVAHGYADAELSQNFKRLNASDEDWRGFPSAMIEGSYDLHGQRMQSYNRMVFAIGAPPANQRYLVQLTVTSFAEEAAAQGADIEAIISGFTVAAP